MAILRYLDPVDNEWKPLGLAGPPGPEGPAGPMGPEGPPADTGILVKKSGDTMAGPLLAAQHPTDPMEVATKTYVDSKVASGDYVAGGSAPIGAIIAWGGASVPTGWHLCDGSAHGSALLEAVTGSPNTPDLRDRFIVGAGLTHVKGAQGGAALVSLSTANLPAHSHGVSDPGHAHGVNDSGHGHAVDGPGGHSWGVIFGGGTYGTTFSFHPDGVNAGNSYGNEPLKANAAFSGISVAGNYSGVSITNTGSGTAHENMPPFYALAYIIKKAAEVTDDFKNAFVGTDGGAMTGPLLLSGAPMAPLGAATKGYVDGRVTVAQRRAEHATSPVPSGYDDEMWGGAHRSALGNVRAGDAISVDFSIYYHGTGSVSYHPAILNSAGTVIQWLVPRDSMYSDWYSEQGQPRVDSFGTNVAVAVNADAAILSIWCRNSSGAMANVGVPGLPVSLSAILYRKS